MPTVFLASMFSGGYDYTPDPQNPGVYDETYDRTNYYWNTDTKEIETTGPFPEHYSLGYSGAIGPTGEYKPANELVDRYTVPNAATDPGYIAGQEGRTFRLYHDGNGGVRYEEENVLRIVSISVTDALPDNTEGKAEIVVDSLFDSPITAMVSGQWTHTSDGVVGPVPSAIFLNHNYDAQPTNRLSYRFEDLVEGAYTLSLLVADGQPVLTGTFTIRKQTAPIRNCDLAFGAIIPKAPALGQATGTLEVHTTGGWGEIEISLLQDGVAVVPPVSPVRYQKGVGFGILVGLTSGLYSLTAKVVGASPPCVISIPEVSIPLPDLEIGDQLTFLPWVQTSLGSAALMNPSQSQGLRPTLELSATLAIDAGTSRNQTQTVASTTAEIYGPGDVLGINQRAILATVPVPDAVGFSPLQLAAIDFKEEDLPWRYSMRMAPALAAIAATATTAAVVATAAAPLPWCMLLVLRADEFEALPLTGQPLPSIKIKGSANAVTHVYPSTDAQQQKLWAHVQANASLGTPATPASGSTAAVPYAPPTPERINEFLNNTLPQHPDLAYSRVLCPRRLEADTTYQAFLVPALEGGRLAGLGLPFGATQVRASAIPTTLVPLPAPPLPPIPDITFPVYFQWKFTTGSEEDFESLVTQLHPANGATSAAAAPNLGVHIAANTYVLPMPALLVDADAAPAPVTAAAQELAVAQYLHAQLVPGRRVGSRPVVTPPLYGRAYMVTPNLLAPTVAVAPSWKHTLNLDPRYRALAALGAQVVQDNQEEYVRRAWEQVQDILLANDKLRGAQYGLRTTTGLRDQHLPLEAAASAGAAGSLTGTTNNLTAPVAAKGTSSSTAVTAPGPAPTASARVGMADYGLHLTGLALGRIRVSADTIAAAAETNPSAPLAKVTVREAIRRSSTPLAAFSPTFRRIMKPFGNYQVGEAGRPLRPTQPAPAEVSGDLRQTGTSLAQRDAVLSQLVGGQLTAAPERAEQVRAYQFLDDKVDTLLETSAINNRTLSAPSLSGEASERFGLAFARFRTQNSNPTAPVEPGDAVHFHKPQYVRPDLPLEAIKADVVVGTEPGPVFQVRIKQASPVVDTPPAVVAGDYDDPDFNANDFYVGDFGEPGMPVPGDWRAADFVASDFQVDDYLPAAAPAPAPAPATFARGAVAATTPAVPAAPAGLPVIRQAKVTPVFKDPMGEALRLRHPELFVPGLGEFPAGGVAVLDVNRAFLEAYMVGLNHALGSELLWRGFPVDVRGTFFQQFWDVREHFNTTLAPGEVPSAAAEAAMLDIKPLDQWIGRALGSNAPDLSTIAPPGQPSPPARVANPLRMAVRSELLRRYPNLVLALQLKTELTADPALMLHPLQRLAVGQDLVVVTFDVEQAWAKTHHNLVLMERPGQPKFGLDETAPVADQPVPPQTTIANPLSWNDFSWQYLGTPAGSVVTINPTGRPHATAEPREVAYLTDSATVAYALFQEPIMATIPLSGLVD